MTDGFHEMARELRGRIGEHFRCLETIQESRERAAKIDTILAAALRSVDAEARLTGMCIVLAAWAEQDWDKAEEFCAYQPNWPTITWKEVKRIAEASAPGLQKEESR